MNEKMEAAMKQAGINEEKKAEAEEFVSKYKYDILLGIGLAALSIFSFRLGWKKGYKRCVVDTAEVIEDIEKDTLKRVCPKVNVKYVVERTGDLSGRTYDEYYNYIFKKDSGIGNVIHSAAEEASDASIKYTQKLIDTIIDAKEAK